MSDSYNKWGWLALISSVFLSSFWVLYFMVVQVPVDLGEESELLASPVSSQVDVSQVENYWESSDVMVQKGMQIYGVYCALCHGAQGHGDGVAGRGLKPPPRDFSKGDWKYGGTRISLYKVISEGSEGTSMASFSHIPRLERWALVHFIRKLSKKPIVDDSLKTKEFAENAK